MITLGSYKIFLLFYKCRDRRWPYNRVYILKSFFYINCCCFSDVLQLRDPAIMLSLYKRSTENVNISSYSALYSRRRVVGCGRYHSTQIGPFD
jgi:hypothetical protein